MEGEKKRIDINKLIEGSGVVLKCGDKAKKEKPDDSNSQRCDPPTGITLKWNGNSWQSIDGIKNRLYRINLGRDLDNLLKKHAIREDVLTCRQMENVLMYRKLFNEV